MKVASIVKHETPKILQGIFSNCTPYWEPYELFLLFGQIEIYLIVVLEVAR